MSHAPDLSDALTPAVVEVLDALYRASHPLQSVEADNFAFNVLLNALCSVMESIRKEAPEQYATYLEAAVLTLQGE